MLIKKLLDPKIDYVFKRVFGYKGNEKITTNLISSIINKKIFFIRKNDCYINNRL